MPNGKGFLTLNDSLHLADALERSNAGPVLLFKHSSACAISAWARHRLSALTESEDIPVFELVVQHARELSRQIAQEFGIRHETPQVILLVKGRPVFHTSHGGISSDVIREAAVRAAREAGSS